VRFAIVLRAICNRFAISVQSLFIALQSHRDCDATIAQQLQSDLVGIVL
jgi:hypothetical protein